MKTIVVLWITFFCIVGLWAQEAILNPNLITVARIKYTGGGDWYCDPSSLPNLMEFVRENTDIPAVDLGKAVKLTDEDLFNYPFLYISGHGNISFSNEEVKRLRTYLTSGGFLHADDNYGMDESFRREMKKVFPDKELVELPFSHEIYHIYYDFPAGLPKIHKHDEKPAQGFGIFHEGRMVVFYSYESDLGDGWEDPQVHNDPPEKRLEALKMGANILIYALSQR
ncbi:DUF4159 domain-containing protein [bacterium]|nr:DUF4159 domain-containing protein [bacterium]